MQHGASISSAQLIKIFTRGKTSRISARSLLDFFQPLEAWLELQNRNESVIGWNSNIQDISLFQSFNGSSNEKIVWNNSIGLCLLIVLMLR